MVEGRSRGCGLRRWSTGSWRRTRSLLCDTEVDDIHDAGNLILDLLGELLGQLLAGKLEVTEIQSKGKLGEVKFAGSSGIGQSPTRQPSQWLRMHLCSKPQTTHQI